MSVTVQIVDGPLSPAGDAQTPGAGAIMTFEGVVRPLESDQAIIALDYEVYSPMAENMLTGLARELLDRHGLLAIAVWHSRGRVGVGEVSFRLRIVSKHRKEGIAAMDEFIDRLKQDVPIWKRAVPGGLT
jgi:molybdopterin synthase catalytic subunit